VIKEKRIPVPKFVRRAHEQFLERKKFFHELKERGNKNPRDG
jgi:hypothetical protein